MERKEHDIKAYLSFEVIEHLTPKEKIRRKRAARAKSILGYLAAFFFVLAIVISFYAIQRLNVPLYVATGVLMFISFLLFIGKCIAGLIYDNPSLKDDGIETSNYPYPINDYL